MDVKPGNIYTFICVCTFKKTPLTDLSQIESRCVGLQARVAVYVKGQEDAVLLLPVRAVGILTVNPRSVSAQLACDIILVPKAVTNRLLLTNTDNMVFFFQNRPHRCAFTRSTAALDLELVLVHEQWKEPL